MQQEFRGGKNIDLRTTHSLHIHGGFDLVTDRTELHRGGGGAMIVRPKNAVFVVVVGPLC